MMPLIMAVNFAVYFSLLLDRGLLDSGIPGTLRERVVSVGASLDSET